jgi:molybdate transport system substrate-binding protein
MKRLPALLIALLLIFNLTGCAESSKQTASASPAATASEASDTAASTAPVELTIAAASSLTAALNEIVANYASDAPDVKITVNYGGSGNLQTQIENGAPTDIFFSAAMKQMDALEQGGFMVTESIIKLLKNEIVLIVPGDSTLPIDSFDQLGTDLISKIALGDTASVPAGQYAKETLSALNLWDKVSEKTVYGTDVKQVLTWVSSGDVDCGIVYSTDAAADHSVRRIASAPADTHKDIVYPVGIVKSSTHQDAAGAFADYLQSNKSMDVFKKYGFIAG